ncbi:MAG: ABC transporter ATP-binding protein [Myxococcota bacterium]|nr:ABC transporter ATP-binding protein [Myxococcota bacterium]MEC9391427.1 ABC transporter ATP-binding protein [Myxococcota bacterium]
MNAPAIAVNGLRKEYGRVVAVDGIDLVAQPGEFVGLVGHNGAGKTTTIRMLTGQLAPTAGTVVVAGADVVADPGAARRMLGTVPEHPTLYEYLSAREMIEFVAEIRGSGDVDWALGVAGLGTDADRLIREYSQGMRRKTALAAALVARPPVLVLDEALNGLDPASAVRVVGVLNELRQDGATVILSTHILDTLEKVADRIVLMEQGSVVIDGGVDRLDEARARLSAAG